MALEYPLKAHTDSLGGFKNQGIQNPYPKSAFWFLQVKQESLCKWFTLARIRERLTDSIKNIILSVYESFKLRLLVTKTVSTMTLQSGLHLKRVNLWRVHVYIYQVPRVALAYALWKNKLLFFVTLQSQWSIIFV